MIYSLIAFLGSGLYAQGMDAPGHTYIILRVAGTVRDADTRCIAVTSAAAASEALDRSLPEEARDWVRRDGGNTRLSAWAEDPRTFVSDRVDRCVAVRGSLRRNRKGELLFDFEIVPSGRSPGTTGVIRETGVRGRDARTALEAILEEKGLDWSVTADTPFEAAAVNPGNFGEIYRVRVLYDLDRRAARGIP